MKSFKKIVALLCAFVIAFSAVSFAFAQSAETEEPLNLLLLGDSITQGFGIVNRDEACYGRIVADTNGYGYKNYARVAYNTSDMLEMIESGKLDEDIRNADIINISIGSNNYLANDDVVMIVIGALLGYNNKQLDEIAQWIYEDYNKIYDEIRGLNPDATLIFNNIYCAWKGIGYIPFHKATDRINEALNKFKADHPDDIIILDIASVITGHGEYVAADSVHPNAAGNVAIAKQFLKLLKDLGLGEKTEPVVNAEGIDYNFYQQNFGKVAGTLIWMIVSTLTLHF